jgi:hypothetical protein
MTKDELIHTIRMIAQGRPNFAEALADHLMPEPADVHLDKVEDASPVDEVKAEMVEIEVEPSPTSWAGLEKARADVVAEYFAPEPPPPDPAPAKPKRKKA